MKKLTLPLAIASLLLSSQALAATFNVSSTAELRQALSDAASNEEDDTILLADGTYNTNDDGVGTFVYLSTENSSLTLRGSGPNRVTLSGNNTNKILNHSTTVDASLIVEGLSFIDAVSYDNGGAIFASHTIEVINCRFNNNQTSTHGGAIYSMDTSTGNAIDGPIVILRNSVFTNNQAQSGGAIYARNIDITNSQFSNNLALRDGGAILSYSGFVISEIIDSTFSNNTSERLGGAMWVSAGNGNYGAGYGLIIENTDFIENTAAEIGGGFYSKGPLFINNSLFDSNESTKWDGGGFYNVNHLDVNITNSRFKNNNSGSCGGGFRTTGAKVTNSIFLRNNAQLGGGAICGSNAVSIANSLFKGNSSAVDIHSDYKFNVIVNSIFINNGQDLLRSSQSSPNHFFTLKNNYIDLENVSLLYFEENNIFDDINVGFENSENDNYLLTSESDLIDAGTSSAEYATIAAVDFNNNSRISGGSIDIGPYEYSLTTPLISSFAFSGTAQEQSELTFSAEYSFAEGRSFVTLEFDYGSGYTTDNTFTFNEAGNYNVMVKVTDNAGEFSTSSLSVTVADLPWEEMSFDQRLVDAIPANRYEDIMQGISSERSEATQSGRQYVQDNPSEFNLLSIETLAPSQSDINELAIGWSLISTNTVLSDLTIFNDVKVIWIYVSGAWYGWSPDLEILEQIQSSENHQVIESIPAKSGIWILK